MATQQCQGTVVPAQSFSAEAGAQALRKAMKGLGTNEAEIVRVMSSHNNQQRQEIALNFKTQFGKDLRQELKSEISGKFEDLVLALLEPPIKFDTKEVHDAISGVGTNESALIEILCSRSNEEIKEIKAMYKTLYKKDLEKDVMSDTSGHFKRLLVSQLAASREEPTSVDTCKADQDADDFFKAGADKIGTDESEFNRVLCLRSYPQLRQMFQSYRIKYGKEIESVIDSETSGYIKDGYLAIVQIARNTPLYFAQRLYKCMKGAGTDDRTLIRVVVSRSEFKTVHYLAGSALNSSFQVDMAQIKQEFQKQYGKTLGSFIKGDTSGDYKKLLMALCNEA